MTFCTPWCPLAYSFKEPTPLPTLSKFLKKVNSEQIPSNHRKLGSYINLEAALLGSRGLYAQGLLCTVPA